MDRTLFRTTAVAGLIVCLGATAAIAGQGHHGAMAVPYRPIRGLHAFGGYGYHRMPPVAGTIHAQQGYGGQVYGGQAYGGQSYGGQVAGGYAPYRRRPAVYSVQGQGYGAPLPAYGSQNGYGSPQGAPYGGGRERVAGMRLEARQGGQYGYRRSRYGNGYGYGGAAAAGVVAGYALGGAYGGYGYDNAAPYDTGEVTAGAYDTGYPTPETPLTVHYGEPAAPATETSGLFGTGGYALDGQVQDVGYGGPTVAGYGIGGTTGWAPGIAPAGGLAVYSPGAYGPGPRVITIPSHYRTGGCTCAAQPGY